MNETPRPGAPPPGASTRHELTLLMPDSAPHLGTVLGSAGMTHAGLLLLLFLLVFLRPPITDRASELPSLLDATSVVFYSEPAAPGGSGGGGERSPLPRRAAPVPAMRPLPAVVPEATLQPVEPEPIVMDVPEVPNTAPIAMIASGPPVPGVSGPGEGPGAGGGRDGGIGNGGRGGAGQNGVGGVGDGAGCGGSVTDPVSLNSPRPMYTGSAVQRAVRGDVTVSCVVTTTGETTGCVVVRSLDRNLHGLDDQALKTAGEFRFRPAMCRDVAVPMRVNIIITFNLR